MECVEDRWANGPERPERAVRPENSVTPGGRKVQASLPWASAACHGDLTGPRAPLLTLALPTFPFALHLPAMLDDIRRLFRESIEAFLSEANSRDPEDQVSALLTAMRRELVAAKAAIPEYAREIERVREELGRERELVSLCERRATMAEKIGDAETVRVAREFGARHAARVTVLEQKLAAAEAELSLHRAEADEMSARYKEADTNRFGLVAQIRLANTRGRTGAADAGGGFSDFDRMAERITRDADTLDARIDIDNAMGGGSSGPPPPPPDDVEARLRELKRRMGKRD